MRSGAGAAVRACEVVGRALPRFEEDVRGWSSVGGDLGRRGPQGVTGRQRRGREARDAVVVDVGAVAGGHAVPLARLPLPRCPARGASWWLKW